MICIFRLILILDKRIMRLKFLWILPLATLFIFGCRAEKASGVVDLLVTGNTQTQFDPCG